MNDECCFDEKRTFETRKLYKMIGDMLPRAEKT